MDPVRFDRIAKSLSRPETRRRVFGLLTAVPIVGGLLDILSPEETEAAGRRKRRKKGRKRPNRKHKKQKCSPDSVAQTCAGKCGSVTNNCKQAVDCEACTCDPPCGTCERCNGTTCEACDPCCDDVCCSQAGAICHATTGACCVPESRAQTCDEKCGEVTNACGVVVDCGPCTCTPTCPSCQICDEDTGQCVTDPDQQGDACGSAGQVCQANGTCACDAASCPDCTTCGGDGQCGACTDCCDGEGVCQDGDRNAACGRGGITCEVCTGQDECQDQTCVCVPDCTGKLCGSDGCSGSCGTCSNGLACIAGSCQACTSHAECGVNQLCDDGTCVTFDVCASGCAHTSVQAAINAAAAGATIRIGPGTYAGNGTGVVDIFKKNLTLVGAGTGAAGTIFVGGVGVRVVEVDGAVVGLRDLTVTGGGDATTQGGGIHNVAGATLTLTGVLVTGNTADQGGGILNRFSSSVTLNAGTVVTGNTATVGGGIFNSGGTVTRNPGSDVSGNSADVQPADCYGC